MWDSWWFGQIKIIRTKREGREQKVSGICIFLDPNKAGLDSLSERVSQYWPLHFPHSAALQHCSTAVSACTVSSLLAAAGRLITLKSWPGWSDMQSHSSNPDRENSGQLRLGSFLTRISTCWLLLHLQGSLCSRDTININLGVSPNSQSDPWYQLLQLKCAASCNRFRTSQKPSITIQWIPQCEGYLFHLMYSYHSE